MTDNQTATNTNNNQKELTNTMNTVQDAIRQQVEETYGIATSEQEAYAEAHAEEIKDAADKAVEEIMKDSAFKRLKTFLNDQWIKMSKGIHKHNLQGVLKTFTLTVTSIVLIFVGNWIAAASVATGSIILGVIALIAFYSGIILLVVVAYIIVCWLIKKITGFNVTEYI